MQSSAHQPTQDRPPIAEDGGSDAFAQAFGGLGDGWPFDGQHHQHLGGLGLGLGLGPLAGGFGGFGLDGLGAGAGGEWFGEADDALGFAGGSADFGEGQLLDFPDLLGPSLSSPIWSETSPSALSSASWDSGVDFGYGGQDLHSPTFPEKAGEPAVRTHRTPSPQGSQAGQNIAAAQAAQDRSTSYGYPYYPDIQDENGFIDPRFLQRIGLCYDPRVLPGLSTTPSPTTQQRPSTPARQSPVFEPEEQKYRPQSVPPATFRAGEVVLSTPPAIGRSPSVKPQLSTSRRAVHSRRRQHSTDGWHITSSPTHSAQPASPSTSRRKDVFIGETSLSKGKGSRDWKGSSYDKDQDSVRKVFTRSYKPSSRSSSAQSANLNNPHLALAKMRTTCDPVQGKLKYAWCLCTTYESKKNEVFVLSGCFAGQVRTARGYDLKKYDQETIQALRAAGEAIDDMRTVPDEELMKRRII